MKSKLMTATALRAPEIEAGADVETEVTNVRVAKHTLIDKDGNAVEDEEAAWGIKYEHRNSKLPVVVMCGEYNEAALRMLAVFGAKTLATNEASQVKQKEGAGADPYSAIQERFDFISGKATGTPQWVDRTGGGSKIDLDAWAHAVVAVGAEATPPKTVDFQVIRDKLEADAGFRSMVRKVPAVTEKYTALKGQQVRTVSDVFAGLGI